MKVAITTSSFAQFSSVPLDLLKKLSITPVLNPYGRALTEKETIQILSGCVGVAAGTEPLTQQVMDAHPQLKVISRCGVGMDNVDKNAAEKKGVAVYSTPDAPTRAVAELTIGYALDLMRKVSEMDKDVRAGIWKKKMGNLLQNKTVGIIGFGRIGKSVAQLFSLFGCQVIFFDPFVNEESIHGFPKKDLPTLLAKSDIVTLHCSMPQDKKPVLGAKAFEKIKNGAWIINAARGGLIDEAALENALTTGKVTGAALDVFGQEPYSGPLTTFSQVILTPHIGSYAKETRIEMEIATIENLIEGLRLQKLI